jgi:hypothetical protein
VRFGLGVEARASADACDRKKSLPAGGYLAGSIDMQLGFVLACAEEAKGEVETASEVDANTPLREGSIVRHYNRWCSVCKMAKILSPARLELAALGYPLAKSSHT